MILLEPLGDVAPDLIALDERLLLFAGPGLSGRPGPGTWRYREQPVATHFPNGWTAPCVRPGRRSP